MNDTLARSVRDGFRRDIGNALYALRKIKREGLPKAAGKEHRQTLSKSLKILAKFRRAYPRIHDPRPRQMKLL